MKFNKQITIEEWYLKIPSYMIEFSEKELNAKNDKFFVALLISFFSYWYSHNLKQLENNTSFENLNDYSNYKALYEGEWDDLPLEERQEIANKYNLLSHLSLKDILGKIGDCISENTLISLLKILKDTGILTVYKGLQRSTNKNSYLYNPDRLNEWLVKKYGNTNKIQNKPLDEKQAVYWLTTLGYQIQFPDSYKKQQATTKGTSTPTSTGTGTQTQVKTEITEEVLKTFELAVEEIKANVGEQYQVFFEDLKLITINGRVLIAVKSEAIKNHLNSKYSELISNVIGKHFGTGYEITISIPNEIVKVWNEVKVELQKTSTTASGLDYFTIVKFEKNTIYIQYKERSKNIESWFVTVMQPKLNENLKNRNYQVRLVK